MMKHKSVLIAGGAGFIGSNIAKRFRNAGFRVTVIDTKKISMPGITCIQARIEKVRGLAKVIRESELIIDCMGWTSHLAALRNPDKDLRLNAESHLFLIQQLKEFHDKKVIYLGSSSQFGNTQTSVIREDSPMTPVDIQGIHKVAAESYYRVYAKLYNLNVVSVRFPNCFGENQPRSGKDIGLIGNLIRDIVRGKTVELFGNKRKRTLVYVKDLAEVIFRISRKDFRGFTALNVNGKNISIENLIQIIVKQAGAGAYRVSAMPFAVKVIDSSGKQLRETRLTRLIGAYPKTKIETALQNTLAYFKSNSNSI